MTLRKRLDKLEGKRGTTAHGPSVIFLCDGETGEPLSAMLMRGGTLTREDGEAAEAFTARAMVEVSENSALSVMGSECG